MSASPSPTAAAVIVAAGNSRRMRESAADQTVRKPLIELGGRPLLETTCAAFDACPLVAEIALVVHPDDADVIRELAGARPAFAKVGPIVPGGEQRVDSVRNGARAAGDFDVLAVHDAARPLVTPAAIERAIRTAAAEGAALLAVPMRDTVKSSEDGRRVERTLERTSLWSAQTPQCFDAERFRDILARAEADGFRPTDDSALWERYIGPVAIVAGEANNVKITSQDDLELARALLARRVAGREHPS